jgi:hypothetical protein
LEEEDGGGGGRGGISSFFFFFVTSRFLNGRPVTGYVLSSLLSFLPFLNNVP